MRRNRDLKTRAAMVEECRCVPTSPFYLRWLNRFGGMDYWLFSVRQEYGTKQDSQELFNPHIADPDKAAGTDYAISKRITRSLVVGAEGLSLNECEELGLICMSPVVQYLDDGAWFDCVVEKSDNDFFTSDGTHAVEITLRLPSLQLQF